MRMVILVGLVVAFAGGVVGGAFAQAPTCKAQATEKKLAGAALNSFMKKCESDAQKSCDTSAASKKLAGAAKASFTKKCVTDAVGA
jgi:psiF repeat